MHKSTKESLKLLFPELKKEFINGNIDGEKLTYVIKRFDLKYLRSNLIKFLATNYGLTKKIRGRKSRLYSMDYKKAELLSNSSIAEEFERFIHLNNIKKTNPNIIINRDIRLGSKIYYYLDGLIYKGIIDQAKLLDGKIEYYIKEKNVKGLIASTYLEELFNKIKKELSSKIIDTTELENDGDK